MNPNLDRIIQQNLAEAIVSDEMERRAVDAIADEVALLSTALAELTGNNPVDVAADIATYVGELLNEAGIATN
ncbi:MAG: hypothetical protein ACK4NC_07190 [Candidatus Gracilibacteria bacterium]